MLISEICYYLLDVNLYTVPLGCFNSFVYKNYVYKAFVHHTMHQNPNSKIMDYAEQTIIKYLCN